MVIPNPATQWTCCQEKSTCLASSVPVGMSCFQAVDSGVAVGFGSPSLELKLTRNRALCSGRCTRAWPPNNSTWPECNKVVWMGSRGCIFVGSKGCILVGHTSSRELEVLEKKEKNFFIRKGSGLLLLFLLSLIPTNTLL